MNGSDAEPGVLPRILEMVFLQLSELAKDTQYEYHVLANYLEIYNETIIDLLPAEKDEKAVLEIKEDKAGVIFVTGLKEERLQSPEDGRRLLQVGQQNRRVLMPFTKPSLTLSPSTFFFCRIQEGCRNLLEP